MSDTFAPREKTTLYETKPWFHFYWAPVPLGLAPLA